MSGTLPFGLLKFNAMQVVVVFLPKVEVLMSLSLGDNG